MTSSLPRKCSTAELRGHELGTCEKWSGKRGSNPRPSAWKADALPTELFPRWLFRGGGRRIRTSVGIRRQIYSLLPLAARASLQVMKFKRASSARDGAGDRTRTRNLLITNQLLYQLSHASLAPSLRSHRGAPFGCPLGGRRLLHVTPRAVKRVFDNPSIVGDIPLGSRNRL